MKFKRGSRIYWSQLLFPTGCVESNTAQVFKKTLFESTFSWSGESFVRPKQSKDVEKIQKYGIWLLLGHSQNLAVAGKCAAFGSERVYDVPTRYREVVLTLSKSEVLI